MFTRTLGKLLTRENLMTTLIEFLKTLFRAGDGELRAPVSADDHPLLERRSADADALVLAGGHLTLRW